MKNTIISPSHYFHVHYGKDDRRTLREDQVGKQSESLPAAILIMAEKHPECSVEKITNIERVDFNKDLYYNLETEGAELKFEAEAFLYAIENSPTDKDFDKEDLFVAARLLANMKKRLISTEKMIDDQLTFFDFVA